MKRRVFGPVLHKPQESDKTMLFRCFSASQHR